MKIQPIETERLVIRNFLPDDAQALYGILGDGETMKNLEPAYDFPKTEAFLHSFCIGKNGAVAAVHRQSQKVIGYILFHETQPSVYEMGWIIHRGYWRQGYAYEACKAVIAYAFRKTNARKIFAETVDGVKSVGLMKKLGMTFEGVQKNNGAELFCYGLLREGGY